MSQVRIRRQCQVRTITIGTSVANSTSFNGSGFAGATLLISGHAGATTLVMHGSVDGQTYSPIYSADGTLATLTISSDGGVVAMPDAAFGVRLIRLVADVDLGTAATTSVSLKA